VHAVIVWSSTKLAKVIHARRIHLASICQEESVFAAGRNVDNFDVALDEVAH
jgi:hypothetical protein